MYYNGRIFSFLTSPAFTWLAIHVEPVVVLVVWNVQ